MTSSRKTHTILLGLSSLLLWMAAGPVHAQLIINDTLTGGSSSYDWKALNGACLTAGDGTGKIPKCDGLSYYSGKTLVGGTTGRLPDQVGSGALRLTNGDTKSDGSNGDNQTGAVVSNFTFPTNQGLQVTFSTVTYGGDGNNGTGADGISFFLADGSKDPTVGALGGSLGYSCSNVNGTYDGVIGGYIGLGIDEYGNFSNPADNTNTGPGFQAGRISLRGAGSTAFDFLSTNATTKAYYPTSLSASDRAEAIRNTCRTGTVWNYSGKSVNGVDNKKETSIKLAFNYPLITSSNLPAGVSISNQQGTSKPLRSKATPITYGIKVTQDGLMDLSYSVNGGAAQTVLTNQSITASNGPLPATFRFGFSAGTGGSNNVHEITCFKAAPVNQAASSAGTNVQQSARVEAGTQVYLAYYHPTNSWGELTATNLLLDPVTDKVSIATLANWNASCVLTGGLCQATGGNSVTAQAPAARTMLTWNPTAGTGIPFQWDQLTADQKAALALGDTTITDKRLRYLRGDRTGETTTAGGTFRARTGVLGDIIDSSPVWVGPPSLPYDGAWPDALYPTASAPEAVASAQLYSAFKTTKGGRQNAVYVGANDGFLHAFRSGGYNTAGDFVANATTPNDGREILAFMPSPVLKTIHGSDQNLDFSSTRYSHNFYVDATPGTGDLFYGNAWHTWLVGGVGPGGNATGPVVGKTATAKGIIYALDITDPSTFSESAANSIVKGEWTSDTITCDVANCGLNLGATYGTPIIRRLHNGKWAALFGNGLNSSNGTAGMFIMIVDPTSGATSFRYIDTGYGPSRDPAGANAKNGIAYVTSADLDGDHVTDYAYGGDVFGNVWRFDLTSTDPTAWSVAAAPLFTTATGQPITTRVTVSSIQGVGPQGQPGVIIGFGTGQQLPQTIISGAQFATGTQALFGVWDWNMTSWNGKATGASQYATATGAPTTLKTTNLQPQSVTFTSTASGNVPSYRTLSSTKVCWQGSNACTTGNNKYGWTLPLPANTEQVVYNPTTAYGMFLVNSTIPAEPLAALTCDARAASGFTMALSLANGGAPKDSFFANTNDQFVTINNGGIVTGIGLSATGTPSIVSAQGRPYLVQQTVDGSGVVTKINPGANGAGGRLTWIKRR